MTFLLSMLDGFGLGIEFAACLTGEGSPGPDPETLAAPVLTLTSSGVNPPTWDTYLPDAAIGDTLRLQIADNAEFTDTLEETNLLDSDEAMLGEIEFAIANGLADGPTYIRMRAERDALASDWSNVLFDTIETAAPPAVQRTFRGAANNDLGYGMGPSLLSNVPISDGDTVFVIVHNQPNSGVPSSQLNGITANSGAIVFAKLADSNGGAGATKQASLWRATTAGVIELDIVATVSDSTQKMALAVVTLAGGDYVAGSFAGAAKTVAGEDAITLGGPHSVPPDGEVVLLASLLEPGITFAWSGAVAINELDDAVGAQSLAVQSATGSPTLAGPNAGGFGYKDMMWSAFAWEPTA